MQSSRIFLISLLNIVFIAACIYIYLDFRQSFMVFLPLIFSSILILLVSYEACFGIILVYTCFDGMLKIISGYNTVIHIAPDIVVGVFILRLLIDGATHRLRKKILLPPMTLLFILHFLWVTVEIANPYGLGFLAGVAAYKVYITFLLLYFLAYSFLEDPLFLENIMWVGIITMCIQAVTSIYQFNNGWSSLLSISANYSKVFMAQFSGIAFRPFGTSSGPGGAAIWGYLTFPLFIALFFKTQKLFLKVLLAALIGLVLYTLFISQVRSAIIKCAIGFFVTTTLIYWRSPLKLIAGFFTLLGGAYAYQFLKFLDDPRFEYAQKRLSMLYNLEKLKSARQLAVWDRIAYFWENAPFGIGLSRTGAASGYFRESIQKDKLWGINWSFTDNLFLTLITELGFVGSIFYIILIYGTPLIVIWRLIKFSAKRTEARFLVAGALGVIVASLAGHVASEGSLYAPECVFFWIFMGGAMRLSNQNYLT